MDRDQFIKIFSLRCLAMFGIISLIESCTPTKYLKGVLSGAFLEIPLDAFEYAKKGELRFRTFVIVQNSALRYPICLYRLSATEYQALLMKCTHQGTELQVYGDRLQCPAHGSEFTKSGAVQNGPAATSLKLFPVQIEANKIKINLA